MRVIGDQTESTVISVIQKEAKTRQFVIVDLEGTASRLVSRAIARASLVLIPLQGSAVDARQASRAVGLIREEEELVDVKFCSGSFLRELVRQFRVASIGRLPPLSKQHPSLL